MPEVTLRFVCQTGFWARLIRLAQYGFEETHVDTVMPDGRLLGAHYDGGVKINAWGYDRGQFTREDFVSFYLSDKQAHNYYQFLEQQVGKPYDTRAIAAFVTGRDWQSPDAWYCAEVKAGGLVACSVFPAPLAVKVNHVSVRDLRLLISALKAP